MDAISHDYQTAGKADSSDCPLTTHHRVLNKRLSRVILYGRKPEDLIDRRTILQRCVEEIGRVRDSDKSECGKFLNGQLDENVMDDQ